MSEGRRGPIEWMARNRVAANLLMIVLAAGGLAIAPQLTQEVFPEVTLDRVVVSVAYPGASPEEIEEGLVVSIEDAVRGLDGVQEVLSTAREGAAVVTAELLSGADPSQVLNDIDSAVNRIASFPADAEKPIIRLASNRRGVISVILHGHVGESTLHGASEGLRRALLRDPAITQVEASGLPPPEISIEVPRASLRALDLTLPEIAARLGRASIELPGGEIETPGQRVMVRTSERRRVGAAFGRAVVVQGPGGARLTAADIGEVRDGFRDTDEAAYYDGRRAVRLDVFRVGDQSPIDVAAAVRDVIAEQRASLPAGVELAVWNDTSDLYRDRRDLLLENAAIGIVLVIVVLGVFLRPRVAMWVTLGIPISFLGAFWLMWPLGVTINMISMFGFLLVLGIVVDDAIVVGEAAFAQRDGGKDALEAAVDGAREVRTPVTFAVLTSIVAFTPLLFVPGVTGKLIYVIPVIVIAILVMSLVESFFVLPAHLSHERTGGRVMRALERVPSRVGPAVQRFADGRFRRWIGALLRRRYATLAASFAVLLVAVGTIAGGHVRFRFLPEIEGDQVVAQLRMPFGTSPDVTDRISQRLVRSARAAAADLGGDDLVRGTYATVGQMSAASGGPVSAPDSAGGHLAEVAVLLAPSESRSVTARQFANRWRARTGEVAGAQTLAYQFSIGPPAGAPVAVELSHDDLATLERAAEELAGTLRGYAGVVDVDSGVARGKEQIDLELSWPARSLGIDEASLARQVRAAFFGAEVERQQREREELRVYVRLPERERSSLAALERYRIRAPGGGQIPLTEAAVIERGHSYTAIQREDGRRVIEVTSDVRAAATTPGAVMGRLEADALPALIDRYPGLSYERGGEQAERADVTGALARYMPLALLGMYTLLALAFRSYAQPALILLAVPFSLIGALVGHLVMGFDLSIISVFGLIALAGVSVNDSLVLLVTVNEYRAGGTSAHDAAVDGAVRRFRPVVLTSLTTFFGLAPMIFEGSVQARFLIPMAISLGFGVLFVTVIALVVVPAAYLVLEDVRR